MRLIQNIYSRFLVWFKKLGSKYVAKIALDVENGEPLVFELADVLYVGYDEKIQKIILVLKGREPIYLPLTAGNLDFLAKLAPYLRTKIANDVKVANEHLDASIILRKPKLG